MTRFNYGTERDRTDPSQGFKTAASTSRGRRRSAGGRVAEYETSRFPDFRPI
jgi:hypothetical protein